MNIKEARKKKGLTQTKIAELLGVNQNTYSYWENGKTKIDHFTLAKLAEIFEVSTDFLLGIENKTKCNMLKELRSQCNCTQEELAVLTNIPLEDIRAWENGSQEFSLEKIFQHANTKQKIISHKKSELPRFPCLNNKYTKKNIPIVSKEIWNSTKFKFDDFNCDGTIFALKCINNNLEKFKIFSEDYLIIKQQTYIQHNQIAAVIIENTFQVRRYLEKNNIIILESGNDSDETIAFMAKDCKKIKIIGLVSEVIRIL